MVNSGLENAAHHAAVGAQGSSVDRGAAFAGDEGDQVGPSSARMNP